MSESERRLGALADASGSVWKSAAQNLQSKNVANLSAHTAAACSERMRIRTGQGGNPFTVKHFAGGAHCCPLNVFSLRYRLTEGRLVAVRQSLRKKGEAEERIPHGWEDR